MAGNEIVIEIGNKKNQSVFFPPLQDNLRGTWVFENLPRGTVSAMGLQEIPSTPGLRIHLDIDLRKAKRTDPLLYPENAGLYEELKVVHEKLFGKTRGWPTLEIDLPDADAVKTWHYWMKRLVDNKCATLVEGNLNHKLPGRARQAWGSTTAYERDAEAAMRTPEPAKVASPGKNG